MYDGLPQGFLGTGDIYTCWYDKIIKEIDCKVSCIDDTLLYDHTVKILSTLLVPLYGKILNLELSF